MWGYDERLVPGHTAGRHALHIGVDGFGRWLWEASCHHWFGDSPRLRRTGEHLFDTVLLTIRAAGDAPDAVQVALVDGLGTAWGGAVQLTPEWQQLRLPLAALSINSLTREAAGSSRCRSARMAHASSTRRGFTLYLLPVLCFEVAKQVNV